MFKMYFNYSSSFQHTVFLAFICAICFSIGTKTNFVLIAQLQNYTVSHKK